MGRVYFYNLEVGNLYRTIWQGRPEMRVVLDILQPISNALMVRIPLGFYYTNIINSQFKFSDLIFNSLIYNRFILSDHRCTIYTESAVQKYNINVDLNIPEIAQETISILEKRDPRTKIEEWNLAKLKEFYQEIPCDLRPLELSECEGLINDENWTYL